MKISKRDFMRLSAGAGAAAAIGQLGRSASVAQTTSSFRAMVGIFMFGGSDNWNMIVPTDSRYTAYAANRGATLALPLASLTALPGVPFGLHPSLAPLSQAWSEGALSGVMNVGSLYQPLTKALYKSTPTAAPLNLMSHADQQNQWQGLRMRDVNTDGFMGRQNDREVALTTPDLISLGGSTLAIIGESSSPLILPSTGSLVRNGYNAAATDAPTQTRQTALTAFATDTADGLTTQLTGQSIAASYTQAVTANTILTSTTSTVDQHFVNPTTRRRFDERYRPPTPARGADDRGALDARPYAANLFRLPRRLRHALEPSRRRIDHHGHPSQSVQRSGDGDGRVLCGDEGAWTSEQRHRLHHVGLCQNI